MDNLSPPSPTDVSIITTYRCCMKCKMCNIWKYPTAIDREIQAKELEILPDLKFVNITGGEPFVRHDLDEIVEVSFSKAPRVVISTSGYYVDRVLAIAEKFPKIGIRISLEGLSTINDHLRGRDSGFDRGLQTLLGLRKMGVKDIGFGITVSNYNSDDMLHLYELSRNLKMEFATAAFHNSYYFHKSDNVITNKDTVTDNFYELIERLLKENSPKSWFRAFFNLGLINYINGNRRLLPCEAGSVNFFIDPYGEVYPCNGLEKKYWKESMGNIRDCSSFDSLWASEQADKVRQLVRTCPKNCWMVGTAAPVMKKYIKHPLKWVVKNKLRNLFSLGELDRTLPQPFDVGQDPRQGDLRISSQVQVDEAVPENPPVSDGDRRYARKVIGVIGLTDNVFMLRLERGDLSFQPGQNVSIGAHLAYQQNSDYSICSGSNDDYLEFLIRENPTGTTSPVLKNVRQGDMVDIVGPYGDLVIDEPDNDKVNYVFIASGVGIAPFRSFIRSYPVLNYRLIHGVRSSKDTVLGQDFDKERYTACISNDAGEHFHGRIIDYLADCPLEDNSVYYLCGNPIVVNHVQELLRERGISSSAIMTEPFYA